MIVAGVLSGTSLDGIDVGIVAIDAAGMPRLLRFATVALDAALRARIVAAYPPAPCDALTFAMLDADVGDAFGAAVARVADGIELAAVGSHGLTIAHDGARNETWQIGDPFRIRERTGVPVVSDFRRADCAAGGQGAPLVPFLDARLFAAAHEDRIALNLGGIANITVLRAGAAPSAAVAYDTGPANLPIDTYVAARGIGNGRYDDGGALAARGRVDEALLARWLADPYFAASPPKSTGRERFGEPFVTAQRAALDALDVADALATLTALSARTAGAAIAREVPGSATVVVSGGGVHNATLLAGIAAAAPRCRIVDSQEFGVPPDAKEAVLFAVLAYETLEGRASNIPRATGACGPRVLGAIAPAAHRDGAVRGRIR